MTDPYEFLVRESKISCSQEDVLQRIPGWEEKEKAAFSPSQAALPLSTLCGDSSNSGSDEGEAAEEREPAFGLQRPLEWASPDTQACQEDSYNPAFESDRERSLSPHADCCVYGGLWASRLITQSQDVVGGIPHLAHDELHGIVLKSKEPAPLSERVLVKDQNDVPAELLNPSFMLSKEQKIAHLQLVDEDYGEAEPGALANTGRRLKEIPSQTVVPLNLYNGVDGERNNHSNGILDCNDKLINNVDLLEVRIGNKMDSVSHQAFDKRSLVVALNGYPVEPSLSVSKRAEEPSAEDAMVRPRSSAGSYYDVANVNKRKGKGGDHVAQKLKFVNDDNHAQENSKRIMSDTNQPRLKEVKGPQMKTSSEGKRFTGSSATKCVLPFVISNEDSISEIEVKSVMNRNSKSNAAECVLSTESVMDVVMLFSGALPIPCPDDPDLLSVVMSTGVSLPLPFRDCNGHLMCNKSTLT